MEYSVLNISTGGRGACIGGGASEAISKVALNLSEIIITDSMLVLKTDSGSGIGIGETRTPSTFDVGANYIGNLTLVRSHISADIESGSVIGIGRAASHGRIESIDLDQIHLSGDVWGSGAAIGIPDG
jgi:hypothetical protein